MVQNTSIIYLKAPTEYPVPGEHFAAKTNPDYHPTLEDGDVLVRNLYLSLDPYIRGRMRDANIKSYTPPFVPGEPLNGRGISEVIESKNPDFPVGAITHGFIGWEQYSLIPKGTGLTVVKDAREAKIPLSHYIGVLGMPGMTAYSSIKEIGQPKPGETIFISAASGAVGQLAGQLSKIWGLHVIGSAGTDEKVEYLKSIGFDYAFNYKTKDIREELKKAAPNGIDIYFENVGGQTLEIVLDLLNNFGRVIACGMISQYNTKEPYGVRNLMQVVAKRLTIRGFIVSDLYEKYFVDFLSEVSQLILTKKIQYKEDITKGIENAPEAFVGMLKGQNYGKAIVQIAEL